MENNKDFVSFNTGGFIAHHKKEEITINVPPKVTGDIKDEEPKGFAKASPLFKKLDPDELTDEDKKKAIAKNKKVLKKSDEVSVEDLDQKDSE